MLHFLKRLVGKAWRFFGRGVYTLIIWLPGFHAIRNTQKAQTPCTLTMWFLQKVLGFNRDAYWPVHFTSKVNHYQNIYAGVDTSPGYEPGCYIQGMGKIYIGDYTQIAQNVGIISANHNPYDCRDHDTSETVRIGKYCWIGMNAVILPGVTLGDFTVVGAGAVVTRSFPDGYCVIGGVPAKLLKTLDPAQCVRYKNDPEYNGYIPATRFEHFRKTRLHV